jgi:ABC-type transporter Mla subunit MlaD
MSKDRNHFIAGLFILVSIGLIVTVILSIKGISRIFTPRQERAVSFRLTDDLGGLQVGDEVRLGGFKVGVVKNIEFRNDVNEVKVSATTLPTSVPAAEDKMRLLVTFTMPSQYELRDDATVGIQTTVTGTACLNITDLGQRTETTSELALVGKPSALSALLANLGDVAPHLKPIVADVGVAVGDVRRRVVPELGETLVRYKGAGRHLEDLLGDTKGDIRGTVANLKEATGTVKEKLPETLDSANKFIVQLQKTVGNTEKTLTDLEKSMVNFRQITENARDIVAGNRGKFDGMISSLKTTGDNLKAASSEIRHSPWRLLYKPGKGEMANLNLYDSARQFADGAGSLNDAALALRDALQNKDAKPAEIQELLHKLDTSFASFKQVEDKLWTSVQE